MDGRLTREHLDGVWAAIATPFDAHDRFDEDVFRKNARRLHAAGVHGVYTAWRNSIVTHATWTWDDALRGVIPPMISPLTASFEADVESVERVARYILDGGCSGLFVLGGVGEGA